MSKMHRSEIFYPEQQVYVVKSFKASGRNFVAGDKFDWQRISMSKRRVGQMFFTHHLGHEDALPESLKAYNPAKTLLDLEWTPERIKSELTAKQVKDIHATNTREELINLLATFKKPAEPTGKGEK